MRCLVTLTRHRGSPLPREHVVGNAGVQGHLAIVEEADAAKRRTTLVARVWIDAVYGKKGSTRLPRREACRPLFDARLLFIGQGVMILTGLEQSGSLPVVEYAQTWRVKIVEGPASADPVHRPPTLLDRVQAP